MLFVSVNVMAVDTTALKGLKKKTEKLDGVEWTRYTSKKTPQKSFKEGTEKFDYDNSMFYLYIIVKEDKQAFLRMYVQLEPSNDWIRFNKIEITADGKTFVREFNIKTLAATRAARDQMIELYDAEVMPHEVKMFETVAAAKKVSIRYKGANDHKDLKIKGKHKKAMKDILDAWKKLNI
jgi:hypothetical protein